MLDEGKHMEMVEKGERRLSQRATLGALLIYCYRDSPLYNTPFLVLQHLMEIDSQIMRWRHGHVNMVQRMIGSKMGTGGSSGYQVLLTNV